jgi:sporulation protein YlmC with PRC-barrel domain
MSVLKTLIATTALVAIGATATPAQVASGQNAASGNPFFLQAADPAMMLASDLWEAEVYAPREGSLPTRGTGTTTGQITTGQTTTGQPATSLLAASGEGWNEDAFEEIGSVVDVLIDQQGSIQAIIVEVGGFLGMGAKTVAMPADTVRWHHSYGDNADARTVRVVVPVTREALENAPAFDLSGDGAMRSQRGTGDQSANDRARQAMMAQGGTGAAAMQQRDRTAQATGTRMQSRTGGRAMQARDGYTTLNMEEMTAERLQSADIRGPDGEEIGSVSDVVLSPDGQVTHALVDVGGWLGIGTRTVAIPFDDVDVMRADNDDDVIIYVDYPARRPQARRRPRGPHGGGRPAMSAMTQA